MVRLVYVTFGPVVGEAQRKRSFSTWNQLLKHIRCDGALGTYTIWHSCHVTHDSTPLRWI